MKIAIIINSNRPSPELTEKLNDPEFSQKYNFTYDLFIKAPDEFEPFLRSLNHEAYNAYIIGGGDGTVRTAAQVLIDQDIPLYILPLGSFNFLAKHLGHSNSIEEAFAIIKNNKTKQIDLGDVNGFIFINHAWIGFYYYILKLREKHADLLGKNRLLKLIFNALNFFNVLPIYDLEFLSDAKKVNIKTCLVYISNNDQQTNIMDFGDRPTLSSGLLAVYVFNCNTRWELFKCMLSIITNNFENSKYIKSFTTDNLIIKSRHTSINTVIDGELLKLQTPLNYSMHKKQLKVFIP